MRSVESSSQHDDFGIGVSERLVKGDHDFVALAHHELDLWHALRPHPLLTRAHEFASKTLAAHASRHRQVVDPSAMAVVPDHRCAQQIAFDIAGTQDSRGRTTHSTEKISPGVVPGSRQAALCPQRHSRREQFRGQRSDLHAQTISGQRWGRIALLAMS